MLYLETFCEKYIDIAISNIRTPTKVVYRLFKIEYSKILAYLTNVTVERFDQDLHQYYTLLQKNITSEVELETYDNLYIKDEGIIILFKKWTTNTDTSEDKWVREEFLKRFSESQMTDISS